MFSYYYKLSIIDKLLILMYYYSMEEYVEIRCPNLPYVASSPNSKSDKSEIMCGNIIGGIPMSFATSLRFSMVFHCQSCKMYWKVTFDSSSVPSFLHLDDKINFIRIDDVFGLVDVNGRKVKKRCIDAS